MIETQRLLLRRWEAGDSLPYHRICQDAEVMRHIGAPMSLAAVDEHIARQNGLLDRLGHCFWAAERREDGALIGFCGVKPGPDGTPIAGQIEIGWRLGRAFWGAGLAREAAQASLDWVWASTDAPGVAAITTRANERSWRLMERLGMTRSPAEDFDHPAVPVGDPLRPHIVYRIVRP